MARCDCAISPSDYRGPCKPDNTSQKLHLKGEEELKGIEVGERGLMERVWRG